MENEKPQTQTEQILNSIGGRRGRRGRNLPIGKVTFVSGGHGGLPLLRPQRPQSPNQPAFFAQICRFMFSDGFEVSELVALLVAWAETNHPEAYRHLELSLMNGPEVRRTLGAMYRPDGQRRVNAPHRIASKRARSRSDDFPAAMV